MIQDETRTAIRKLAMNTEATPLGNSGTVD